MIRTAWRQSRARVTLLGILHCMCLNFLELDQELRGSIKPVRLGNRQLLFALRHLLSLPVSIRHFEF